jgi:hypothetical protein
MSKVDISLSDDGGRNSDFGAAVLMSKVDISRESCSERPASITAPSGVDRRSPGARAHVSTATSVS